MEIRLDKTQIGKMHKTPEGYLRGEAVVTRTGVFDYLNPDGTIRKELRHPDDVLSESSLQTLAMIPVTVDHPTTLLTIETATALSVGQTGENHRIDGKLVYMPFAITHTDGIQAVSNGKKELSLGYSCELLPEAGVYNGQEYTHRQTDIRYNHLAIVDRARAGSVARINMDGASVQIAEKMETNMVKIKLDGIEYEAAPEVEKALQRATAEAEALRADAAKNKADMQKEMDEYKAKIDAIKEEMAKLKEEKSDSAISEKVKARIDLERKAARLDSVTVFDGMTDTSVMVSAIKAMRPTFDATDKSEDYIKAAFDMALETAGDPKAIEEQRKKTAVKLDGQAEKDYRADAEEALKNMWKGGK